MVYKCSDHAMNGKPRNRASCGCPECFEFQSVRQKHFQRGEPYSYMLHHDDDSYWLGAVRLLSIVTVRCTPYARANSTYQDRQKHQVSHQELQAFKNICKNNMMLVPRHREGRTRRSLSLA